MLDMASSYSERQVLSAARFEPDKVKVRWQAYDRQGRETRSGKGSWDPEVGIARVTGLEYGRNSLSEAAQVDERLGVTGAPSAVRLAARQQVAGHGQGLVVLIQGMGAAVVRRIAALFTSRRLSSRRPRSRGASRG